MNQNFVAAGQKLAKVFAKTIKEIKPKVSLADIEAKADQYIKAEKSQPSFKMIKNYDWATCINLNEGIVHGLPDQKIISAGDLVSLDMGLYYQGWHADMAYTKLVKSEKLKVKSDKEEMDKFLEVGKKALKEAIKQVKPGNRVGHISQVIEQTVKSNGYFVIPRLTGHGIGQELHQHPMIPGFLTGPINQTPKLKKNMGLAIEIIYTQGKPRMKTADDGWTIETCDGKISALFEKTVVVTTNGARIITPYLFRGELNV